MKKLAEIKRLFPLWLIVAAGAFFAGAAAFFRTYLDWNNVFLVVLSAVLMIAGFSFGLLLAVAAGERSVSAKGQLLTFLIANAVSHALLWTVLTVVNVDGLYNRRAIYITYFIFMPLFLLFALVLLRRIPKLGIRLVNRLLALACVAGMAFAAVSPFLRDPDALTVRLLSPGMPSFEAISAESLAVTQEEKEKCRAWFEEHILLLGDKPAPAFSLDVDGVDLSHTIPFYDITRSETSTNEKGGETATVTLRKSGLEIRVTGTLYEDNATCEWTVYIANAGEQATERISDVLALDADFDLSRPVLYYSTGSDCRADDFTMKKAFLLPTLALHYAPVGGRSSDGYLPFFNLSGRYGGVVAAIGWTGEWKNDVEKTDGGASLAIGQKELDLTLLPGEEIRTPRVSLTFYNSASPMKGFNLFRRFVADCLTPAGASKITSFVLADEFSTLTAQELIEKARAIPEEKLAFFNTFWMDAGWYDYDESWSDGVGTWSANRTKFPNTLLEVGSEAAAMGKRYLLWFEPERVRENTFLYKEGVSHENWLIRPGEGGDWMWNLADDGAMEYLSGYITAALQENGVTLYRQDFNFEPLEYWRQADREIYGGRTGMAENRYVTNLYRYLDSLFAANPGLLMDNCASGGRRLDLEMAARSVPLWRSDYNCDGDRPDILEATQAMTYGLSFWLPSYGTTFYAADEYAARSSILPCCSTGDGTSPFLGAYETERDEMLQNYFPLTEGGAKPSDAVAVQYGLGAQGHAVVYIREKVKAETLTLTFSGLLSDKLYTVVNVDDPTDVTEMSGSQLMKNGFEIPVTETRTALLYRYSLK